LAADLDSPNELTVFQLLINRGDFGTRLPGCTCTGITGNPGRERAGRESTLQPANADVAPEAL
jgi:hypothetical protein